MKMTEKNSQHIGDGVYIGYDGFAIWLHTNDHQFPDNVICLEPQVLDSLIFFCKNKGVIK